MIALRRRAPLLTVCTVAAAVAAPELVTLLTITLWGCFVPLLIALYSVARHASARAALAGAGVTALALAIVMLRVPVIGTVSNIPFNLVPFAGAFVAGRVLRKRHDRHIEVSERARELESGRDETVRAAIAEERSRIARELHDIVAHCVSVMVVQAGAAEDLLDRSPEAARPPLRAVQESGRQAVAELGRMLGLLRGQQAELALKPQPGAAQLAELVEHMSETGLPVVLQVEGTPRLLPPGIELTLYRVAQEALTNTLKHAGPAAARVVLRYGDHAVEALDVLDNGRSPGDARHWPRADRDAGACDALRRIPGGRSLPAGRFRGAGGASGGRCGAMIRVLLADDQALVRGGFRSILDGQDDINVVGEACNGVEALDQAATSNPDVILMDIRMPRLDGIEATRRLLSGGRAHARVLILTTFDHDQYVYEALRAGASGFPAQERATARARKRDPDRGGRGTARSRDHPPDDRGCVPRPRPGDGRPRGLETLTSRELEVLGLIAKGRSNAEIAATLFLSEPTIKTHVTRILAKLQLRDRVQAVVLAYECGLIQPGTS